MNVYIFQAALLCEECGKAAQRVFKVAEDSDDYPQGPYSDGGGEADCPQHCDHCHVFLENPLTTDGGNYVRDQFSRAPVGNAVLTEWREFYSYLWD